MADEENPSPNPNEYELVPMTPIRRMEKRIENIEKGGPAQRAVEDLIVAMKGNQKVAQDLISLNTEMIKRVTDLVSIVTTLSTQITEVMAKAGRAETPAAHAADTRKLEEKLEKLEKRLNTMLLASMPRMRRQQQPPAPVYGPPAPA